MFKTFIKTLACITVFSTSTLIANAADFTIDFAGLKSPGCGSQENYDAGKNCSKSRVIDDEYTSSGSKGSLGGIDVTFWVQHTDQGNDFSDANSFSNANKDGFLTLFNSNIQWDTNDNDLKVGQGNLAIINETACGTKCVKPDDRYIGSNSTDASNPTGTPNGGFVFIQFSQAVNLHSIGLADMENSANQKGSFRFYNSAGVTVQNAGNNWTAMNGAGGNTYTEQSFSFANAITTMVIRMQGSGGFTNLAFSKVPEPTTIALFGFGLLALAFKRRNA